MHGWASILKYPPKSQNIIKTSTVTWSKTKNKQQLKCSTHLEYAKNIAKTINSLADQFVLESFPALIMSCTDSSIKYLR